MIDSFVQIHTAFPHFWTIVFFVFGAIVGSFLNVCILRIPRGESIISPSSHCVCGKPIPRWHNIPILSWFILRGRAACCGRRFSIRYAMIELLTAILFAFSWEFLPLSLAAGTMIYLTFAIVLAMQDFDSMTLPDSVLAFFMVAAMFTGTLLTQDLIAMAIGLATGTTILTFIRFFSSVFLKREAMGEGDIYLLAGIGAFFGWRAVIFSLFVGSIFGLIFALAGTILGKWCSREKVVSEDDDGVPESAEIPFGPPLLLAGTLFVFVNYFCGNVFELLGCGSFLFFTCPEN